VKSKQRQNWQKQNKVSPFSFCFCPIEDKKDVLPRTSGEKANAKILIGKSNMSKNNCGKNKQKIPLMFRHSCRFLDKDVFSKEISAHGIKTKSSGLHCTQSSSLVSQTAEKWGKHHISGSIPG
jgi:hypothetical protein